MSSENGETRETGENGDDEEYDKSNAEPPIFI